MSGRRTRAAASKSATKFNAHETCETIIDQNFASPKRKDCKLDIDSIQSMANGRSATKSSPTLHTTTVNVTNGKRNHKNAIGTKSKKPSQPITKYFHMNGYSNVSEAHDNKPNINDSINSEKDLLIVTDTKDALTTIKTTIATTTKSNDEINQNGSILLSPVAKSLPNGQIKQTTPHRIVCCSSPTKKQRLYAKDPVEVFSNLNIRDGSASPKIKTPRSKQHQQKTRRKLIVNETENSENDKLPITNGIENDAVPLVNGDNTTIATKPVLNGTIDQNANKSAPNNNKFVAPKKPASRHVHNTQMTDFYPIRRSIRKTKQMVEQEQSRFIEKAIEKQLEDGLVVKVFPEKGRGIVAGRPFERGEFVVEYIGELIDQTEADRREEEYSKKSEFGCYMYYFKHKEQQWCIDATAETGKLGRLVNHSRNGNLSTKIVSYKNKPHLVLIAKDNIKEGEELTYDYGDRRKEALIHHPWLAF